MELRITSQLAVAIMLLTLMRTSRATVSFSSLQAIVGFSQPCTVAYNTPVANCDVNDFSALGGTGTCSSACQSSLQAAERFVQRLCQGEQADGNTLIGNLFVGDVVSFLCGDNNGGAAASTATPTAAPSAATGEATGATTSSTATSETSPAGTPASTAAASASGSATGTTTSTTASSSISSIPTSIASATGSFTTKPRSSTSSSTSTAAAATKTSDSQGSENDSGGGSPFDSVAGNGSSSSLKNLPLHMLSLFCLSALIFVLQ